MYKNGTLSYRSLEGLEQYAGILIPDSVQEFFRNPRELIDHWTPYHLSELQDLNILFPNHPLGCVPLFRDCGGNEVCLYYKSKDTPLLAGRSSDSGTIFPLDDDIDAFFSSPQNYEDEGHGCSNQARRTCPDGNHSSSRIQDLRSTNS